MTAYEWLCTYLEYVGSGRSGRMWQCPAHDDPSPSLSITEAEDGRVLMHCFAGCTNAEILDILRLQSVAFFEAHPWKPERVARSLDVKCSFPIMELATGSGRGRRGRIVCIEFHEYTQSMRMARERLDTGGKRIKWEYLGKDGMWYPSSGANMAALPLYREHEVKAGVLCGERVVLCESESSVDALNDVGIVATTWAGGADSPRIGRLIEVLRDAEVLWVPDNDQAGLRCDVKIQAEVLPNVRRSWRLIGNEREDARDLVARAALTREYLIALD